MEIIKDGISIDPEVKAGKPCIAGTRITVDYVMDRLAVHGSIKMVRLLSFPHLSKQQIQAAIDFASEAAK